jgi:hypothetical protein
MSRNVESPIDGTCYTASVRVIGNPDLVTVFAIRTRHDLCRITANTTLRSPLPIGEFLVARGAITGEQLDEALNLQRGSPHRRLGWILTMLGFIDELTLERLRAAHLGMTCVSLAGYDGKGHYHLRLPEALSHGEGIAVLHEEEAVVWVAVADATNGRALEQVATVLGKRVVAVMASRRDITRYLRGGATGMALQQQPYFESLDAHRQYLAAAGMAADSPRMLAAGD